MTGGHIPTLFILSGPSGAGKDSVIRELRQHHSDLHYAVTATTRGMRPGEVDGCSYVFMDTATYNARIDAGELLAPANVHGNWYGAPLDPIRDALSSGQDVLLKIDVQGAMQVKRLLPQAVYIFLTAPSFDDLVDRLRYRHTESGEELARRIQDAKFEVAQMPQYDYCVINRLHGLSTAVDDVACIISAERLRVHRQPISFKETIPSTGE
jgi:guanylate kinase